MGRTPSSCPSPPRILNPTLKKTAQRPGFRLASLIFLVIANTIGAGLYTTSGYTLQDLGTPAAVLLIWALGAVLALAGAVSFGALVRALPLSGGEYLFLSRLLHPAAGFVAGWISLLAGFAGSEAFAALAMAEYLPLSPGQGKLLGVVLVVTLALAHGKLVALGTALQNITVFLKALLLGGFIVLGVVLLSLNTHHLTFSFTGAPGHFWIWPYNLLMVSLSFSGYNAAVYVAEECENPKQDIPRALVYGTGITALLYFGANAVFLASAPASVLKGAPDIARVAALALGGPKLAFAVQALVLLSLFTLVSGSAVAGPRVVQKMGEDGFLPRFSLGQASLIQAGLAVTMIVNASLLQQLGYLSLTLALVEMMTIATIFRLPRPERPPLAYPLVFLVGTAFTTLASLKGSLVPVLWALGSLGSGLVVFFILRRRNPHLGQLSS